jgi:hypothetical protein
MRKATLFVSFYLNNRVFDVGDPVANRDDSRRFHFDLRHLFAEAGFDLSTQDINPPEDSTFVLYHDLPKTLPAGHEPERAFLMMMEPPVVKEAAWIERNRIPFRKIFTYHDPLLSDLRFVKIRYAQRFPASVQFQNGLRDRFCTTIIGNKSSQHPLELYSKRLEVIRWFESHHPERFEFYGTGWNQERKGFLSNLFRFSLTGGETFATYGGTVKAKREVLERYRFAICFENTRDLDGYVTEKIFDSFLAGTIPVYLGAPNIGDEIPPDCFIDFRRFGSYEEMFETLARMSHEEVEGYQERILQFLTGPKIHPFQSETVSQTVVKTVLEALS